MTTGPSDIAKNIQFNYFHNELDQHKVIKLSSEAAVFDNRFNLINKKYKLKKASFAKDAKFMRGCISIQSK